MGRRSVLFEERTKLAASGCLEWTGMLDRYGYGYYFTKGIRVRAHRYAWSRVHGAIPAGLFICHRCDNRKCVRIEHLFLGTAADNNADKQRKGRAFHRGTPEVIAKIRALHAERLKLHVIARRSGVSLQTVSKIINRRGMYAAKGDAHV